MPSARVRSCTAKLAPENKEVQKWKIVRLPVAGKRCLLLTAPAHAGLLLALLSLSRSLAIRGPFSPCYPGEKRREGASRYPGLLLALLSLSRLLACSLARLAISLACSLARLLAGSRPKGQPMFLRCARAVGTVLTQAVAPPVLVSSGGSRLFPLPRPAQHTRITPDELEVSPAACVCKDPTQPLSHKHASPPNPRGFPSSRPPSTLTGRAARAGLLRGSCPCRRA